MNKSTQGWKEYINQALTVVIGSINDTFDAQRSNLASNAGELIASVETRIKALNEALLPGTIKKISPDEFMVESFSFRNGPGLVEVSAQSGKPVFKGKNFVQVNSLGEVHIEDKFFVDSYALGVVFASADKKVVKISNVSSMEMKDYVPKTVRSERVSREVQVVEFDDGTIIQVRRIQDFIPVMQDAIWSIEEGGVEVGLITKNKDNSKVITKYHE